MPNAADAAIVRFGKRKRNTKEEHRKRTEAATQSRCPESCEDSDKENGNPIDPKILKAESAQKRAEAAVRDQKKILDRLTKKSSYWEGQAEVARQKVKEAEADRMSRKPE
ncbi:hypothetical protein F5050DRAFT_1709274 [Lentinula boryana]|uniref:Uncharacterized protein n=1 Tax=Lentinula boryana TaxID=40481 RepID=A0ABQ8QNX1_9AGAR|nr:hypothetical protein F5050DRAFT_1709274 [Lentinula boryana]